MNKLKENANEILNLYNYFNGAIIFDKNAIAVYYFNNRHDINDLSEEEVIGKHLQELYPEMDLSRSTIMDALNKGIPTANYMQTILTYKGDRIREINTTIPIFDGEEIISAAEISRYIEKEEKYENIHITSLDLENRTELYTIHDMKSEWDGMKEIKRVIEKVADTDSSILIHGKTGTGKEMVAESIHTSGSRRQKKFVSQNCAAIPANLLESILFGTVRGSFTGAENRKGLLEVADGGTLFLDEINTLDYNLQAKLLKAIENGKIMRVGGTEEIKVNVRIIAATNKDLFMMVQDGTFRDDLYYRLKVVQIDLPELSERSGDIQALTAYFIKQYNKIFGKNILGLSKEAEAFFQNYPWHGNVRELKNTIEGCFNFASGPVIKLEDISWYEPPHKEAPTPILKGTLKETVKAYEKNLITETLHECGNISKAAEKLGLTRQNLNNKMKEYQLDPQSILLV